MTKYIDTDLLCKDILSHSPEDMHSVLRIIENQPTADVVGEIIELLKELKTIITDMTMHKVRVQFVMLSV